MLPPIGLSLAEATSTAIQNGAPIAFGAFNFGSGSAGGAGISDNDSASPKGDSTAVTPVTATEINPIQQLADLAGLGASDPLAGGFQTASQFLGNSGFGANSANTQTPIGSLAGQAGQSAAALAAADTGMPGPIVLVAGGVAVLLVVFMVMR